MRVLVVEDERKLAQVVSSALEAEHYDVVVAATGEDGFYRVYGPMRDAIVRHVNQLLDELAAKTSRKPMAEGITR